jgi:hypothetical protein
MNISISNLMHMVVSILIYIIGKKCVQRIIRRQVERAINGVLAKHGDKMGTPKDCINVNDSIAPWDRPDDPHSSILVWWIRHMIVPINESARVFNDFMDEREKKADAAYIKA